MVIDYEAVVADFREYLSSRPSHGRNDLRDALDRICAANRVREGLIEKVLRLYHVDLTEQLRIQGILPPAEQSPDRTPLMDSDANHRSTH